MLVSCQDKETKSDNISESSTSKITEDFSPKAKVEKPKWTEEELRIHQEKIEVGVEKLKMIFNNQIAQHKKAIEKADQSYKEIDAFEIGRSQETKDKQLLEHFEMVKRYRETVENLQMEYVEIPLHKTYEFQNSPKEVIKHIFYGLEKRDFDKFKHLYDPYLEGNEMALWLCNIKALPEYKKDEFYKDFQNPRIMGEPVLDGNKAIIEIAIGPSSDKLEKIELVM